MKIEDRDGKRFLGGYEIRATTFAHNFEPQLTFHFVGKYLYQLVSTKEGSGPGSVYKFWAKVGGQDDEFRMQL